MSQNSGPFLVSSHGHPGFNPRPPPSSSSSSSKRISNGLMTSSSPGNTSMGPNMGLSSSPSSMRPGGPMGPMKPGSMSMGPMDKSNQMSYSNRYSRKPWPVTRSMHGKNCKLMKNFNIKLYLNFQIKAYVDMMIMKLHIFVQIFQVIVDQWMV